MGTPVWDFNIFLKSVTYRPTLSKLRGRGAVKKKYHVQVGLVHQEEVDVVKDSARIVEIFHGLN